MKRIKCEINSLILVFVISTSLARSKCSLFFIPSEEGGATIYLYSIKHPTLASLTFSIIYFQEGLWIMHCICIIQHTRQYIEGHAHNE